MSEEERKQDDHGQVVAQSLRGRRGARRRPIARVRPDAVASGHERQDRTV